jgi:hypothetical protein
MKESLFIINWGFCFLAAAFIIIGTSQCNMWYVGASVITVMFSIAIQMLLILIRRKG